MSADNGIYIVLFPDGYRVAHAQAIENINYFPKGSQERKDELQDTFGHSDVYRTIEEAEKYANELAKEFDILEYGICYLGQYEGWK